MNEPCDHCTECSEKGYGYCIYCGRPITAAPITDDDKGGDANGLRATVVRASGMVLVFACAAMLFFEIFTVFWGFSEIWPNLTEYRFGILVLIPSPAVLFYVDGIFAIMYYLFIVSGVIASFVFLMYRSRKGLGELSKGKTEGMTEMPLYAVVTLFAATISFNLICVMIVTVFDYTPAVPAPADLWKELYSLMNAAVWEEVICRIALIGLPVMIAGLAVRKEGAWKGLLGGVDVNRFTIILIFISSLIFSYGHVAGWDLFKMLPTFVTGLALGYLFVRFGVYASIMLHFLVNYMSSVRWVFSSLSADAMLSLFLLSVVVLGIPFLVLYAVRGFRRLREEFSDRS
ncbi:MAG: CPBP family glutamic-type intramembrane protease [Methanomassiliicoccaceae archaeon]|nr:CPBP family glutamic-type intramembrane protease [Methanomassiliicoccaceae archaeon]